MKNRYNIVRSLDAKFGFLWKYIIIKEEDVQAQALTFAVDYTVDRTCRRDVALESYPQGKSWQGHPIPSASS